MKNKIEYLIKLNKRFIICSFVSIVIFIIGFATLIASTVSVAMQEPSYPSYPPSSVYPPSTSDTTSSLLAISIVAIIFLVIGGIIGILLLVWSIIRVVKMPEIEKALGSSYTVYFVLSIIGIFIWLLALIVSFLINSKLKEYLRQMELDERAQQSAQGPSGTNMPQGGIPVNGTRQQPIDYEFYNK